MNQISVIIPSKTDFNFLACAEAVRQNEPEIRIVLIDDGLKFDWLPRPHLMPLIRLKTNLPFLFSRNCNYGMKWAENDDIVLLNDDAILKTPGGFHVLQEAAEQNQQYGCIGAVTNVTGKYMQHPHYEGLREIDDIAFVCVFIPRRTIYKIGYLDERYCIDYGVEDKDYCMMIKQAGMKVGVHDNCFVDHASLKSSFRGDPKNGLSFENNYQLYKQKWGVE